jgi:hypothetical protein
MRVRARVRVRSEGKGKDTGRLSDPFPGSNQPRNLGNDGTGFRVKVRIRIGVRVRGLGSEV